MPCDERQFQCSICMKKYSRLEHLKRHALSHTSSCPFVCSQCDKSFKRSDILKRHLLSCNRTAQSSPPTSWTGGPTNARRRACYRCSKWKRRCNLKWPCESCLVQCKQCEYPARSRIFHNDSSQQAREISILTADSSTSLSMGCASSETDAFTDHQNAELGTPTDRSFSSSGFVSGSPENAISDVVDKLTTQSYSALEEKEPANVLEEGTSILLLPCLLQDPADSFSFMVRFTEDRGILCVFESDAVLQMLRRFSLAMPEDQSLSVNHGVQAAINSSPTRIPITQAAESSWADKQLLVCNLWIGDELATKTLDIIDCLRKTTIGAQAGSTASFCWSPAVEAMCLNFFSPPKIRIFLETYWSVWSPNCPIIHHPTFDPLSTPTTLLAALVVLGACHSPSATDRVNVRFWYDLVEEMVYNDPFITFAISNGDCKFYCNADGRRRSIQAIQAGYAVCIYQNWDGTRSARTRIRRRRFNDLIAASRAFGFSRARHGDFNSLTMSAFDWQRFIFEEEAIRTLLWVYLLDSAFVVFNNMPPRLALRELSIGLACSEACFQAEDASKCFNSIKLWVTRIKRPEDSSFYSLIKSFCAVEMDSEALDCASHEAFMNLWCVVSAYHVMIFNLDPSLANTSQYAPIRMGLANWKAVWNQRCLNDDERFFDVPITQLARDAHRYHNEPQLVPTYEPSMWKRSGFWRHAPEYWLLATLYLDHLEYEAPRSETADVDIQHDDTSMARLKSFIQKFQSSGQNARVFSVDLAT